MRAIAVILVLATMIFADPASAYDANDPANCIRPDWDDAKPLTVAKVIARPRVNFVKSPYDDDFKADTCPAATAACRSNAYLVTGDLVLVGQTRGAFTCVSYQTRSRSKKLPGWTRGWLPSATLTPVAPAAAPAPSDWLGNWDQRYAGIEIKPGGLGGRLRIEGIAAYPTARDYHTGAIDAEVRPGTDSIAFLNDGWMPFETQCDSGCRVRMHRIGDLLLVEDNGDCGGAGVTFTGLYHRK
jgi:hypothetical protein